MNEVLRTYYINDGAEDHLTQLGNPSVLWGRAFFYRQVLNEFVDWAFRAPLILYRSAVNFSRYSFGLGKGPLSQFRELHNARARALLGGSLPLGFLLYLRDRKALRSS